MKVLKFWTLILSTLLLFSCASTEEQGGDSSEVSQAAADSSTDSGGGQEVSEETTESDLTSDLNQEDPQENLADLTATPTPEPQADLPPPPAAEPLPLEEPPPPPSGAVAQITSLDFIGKKNGGTVEIKSDIPVQYTTRTNEAEKQFVIEISDAMISKKLQRPFITKEFASNIASFNAYQAQGATNTVRIVLQLRESQLPQVSQDGSSIMIAGGATETPVAVAADPEAEVSTEGLNNPELGSVSKYSYTDFLAGKVKFTGRPISLQVNDVELKEIFDFISEEAGINIVVGEEVTGKITLKLRNIPWDQALSVILQSKQLGYVKTGNILRIAKLTTLQQESDAARAVLESQKQIEPLRVQLFPISYGKVEDLEGQVKEFLSQRGKVKADSRTNTLVVTAVDEEIQRIRKLIQKLDTQTPQVLIEAKVVEARETFNKIVGVAWSQQGQPQSLTDSASLSNSLLLGQPAGGTSNALDLSITGLDIIGDLTSSLRLLEKEEVVKVISSPRIVTLDRKEAKIQQTVQFPVFGSQIGANGQAQSSVQFQDAKLELSVTPQITNDGGIIMQVAIKREFPGAIQIGPEGSSAAARPINKREASTQVLVENGDTVVMGGIYQSDVTESEDGVPWLKDLPIIGALFRTKGNTKEKNELVIFVTPKILNREKAFLKSDEAG